MCEWWEGNYVPVSSLLEATGRGLTSIAFSSRHANCITSNHMLVNVTVSAPWPHCQCQQDTRLNWHSLWWWQVIQVSDLRTEIHTVSFYSCICKSWIQFSCSCLFIIEENYSCQQMLLHWNHMQQVWILAFVIIRTKICFSEGKSVLRHLCWFCVS